MSWCYQCGVDGTPTKAVGVDAEGEPACAMHRNSPVQTAVFNAKFVEKRMAEHKAIQNKEIQQMPTKKCACGCGTDIEITSRGWNYARGHKPKGMKPVPVARKAKPPLQRASGRPDPTQDVSMPVTLKLSEEGLNRLLLGLPLEVKANLLSQYLSNQ